MSVDNNILQPKIQLKGHTAPVLCVKYAKDTFLGSDILASGSGKNNKLKKNKNHSFYHSFTYFTK